MDKFDNICVLKCTEDVLVENIKLLCKHGVSYVPGFDGFMTDGHTFYYVLGNFDDVKNIPFKGEILK